MIRTKPLDIILMTIICHLGCSVFIATTKKQCPLVKNWWCLFDEIVGIKTCKVCFVFVLIKNCCQFGIWTSGLMWYAGPVLVIAPIFCLVCGWMLDARYLSKTTWIWLKLLYELVICLTNLPYSGMLHCLLVVIMLEWKHVHQTKSHYNDQCLSHFDQKVSPQAYAWNELLYTITLRLLL